MYAFSCFIDNGIHYLENAMHGLHVSTGEFVPPELTDHLPLTFTRPETHIHKIINRLERVANAVHGLHVSTGEFVPPELTDHFSLKP
jgi:hypothetical protein